MISRFTRIYVNCAQVIANYSKCLLTRAHFAEILAQLLNICGRNDEKTNGLFLKHAVSYQLVVTRTQLPNYGIIVVT